MSNVLSIVGSQIDDWAFYGYKYLGKRNGQKIFRRAVEQPVARGFLSYSGYPTTFKLTEFAYVDDAGKVVGQSARRVGTFGDYTSAARENVAQFTRYNNKFDMTKYHAVTSKPKAAPDSPHFTLNEQNIKNGLFDQTLFSVKPNGEIMNATRKVSMPNPHNPANPLKCEYEYSPKSFASYTEEIVKKPFDGTSKFITEHTDEVASKALAENAPAAKFQWSVESLRNPNFYKEYAGPGTIKNYTTYHF